MTDDELITQIVCPTCSSLQWMEVHQVELFEGNGFKNVVPKVVRNKDRAYICVNRCAYVCFDGSFEIVS
jgi:hypothetical protein